MSQLLATLSPAQLEAIADAIARGQVLEATQHALVNILGTALHPDVVMELQKELGRNGAQVLAPLLKAVAAERRFATAQSDRRLELVWTGPEREGAGTRDTAVVVRELMSQAEQEILISGYAVFGGRSIFAPLAERLLVRPGLRIRLFLNVRREKHDTRSEEEVVAAFRRYFLRYDWPDGSPPSIYYDPRALHPDPEKRAVLHAKCVVVDDLRALVTSANLTQAAQVRNVEAGILIEDAMVARSLRAQFDDLVSRGMLRAIRTGL